MLANSRSNNEQPNHIIISFLVPAILNSCRARNNSKTVVNSYVIYPIFRAMSMQIFSCQFSNQFLVIILCSCVLCIYYLNLTEEIYKSVNVLFKKSCRTKNTIDSFSSYFDAVSFQKIWFCYCKFKSKDFLNSGRKTEK